MGIQKISLKPSEIYTMLCVNAEKGVYTSYLRGKRCVTEDAFFYEVSASFQFPYYFGENWDAFDECIQDLEWIGVSKLSKIFVVFDDFSKTFVDQKAIQYILQQRIIEYWNRAVEYWESQNITLEVWLNN